MKKDDLNDLGLGANITRRDFINAGLIGSGAALLTMNAPGLARAATQPALQMVGADWTGYGGVGDYARANGNTAAVVNAAHSIRDRGMDFSPGNIEDTGESFDLVVVGGGFAGLGAAYTFMKEAGKNQTCLLLDNHAIFGGEAKQNEFEVDGVRLTAP